MTRHTRNKQLEKLGIKGYVVNVPLHVMTKHHKHENNLDPNFRTIRLKALKVTSRKGTHHPKNNKRLIDKHNRINNIEVYEQLQKGLDNLVFVVYNVDGSPHYLALTYKTQTRTVYFFTKKQPHVSGNGNYFNRIIGVTKHGQMHFGSGIKLPEYMKGIFDKDGYRLVQEHEDGTHSKTY